MSSALTLQDNHYCFVCGRDNPLGFRLRFEHPQKGLLKASVTFKPEHQGYAGIVHGGLVSTVLDEMMVNLAWMEKTPAVTAELTVRLHRPVPTGRPVRFEGRLERDAGRVLYMKSSARDEQDRLLAEASASCIRVKGALQ